MRYFAKCCFLFSSSYEVYRFRHEQFSMIPVPIYTGVEISLESKKPIHWRWSLLLTAAMDIHENLSRVHRESIESTSKTATSQTKFRPCEFATANEKWWTYLSWSSHINAPQVLPNNFKLMQGVHDRGSLINCSWSTMSQRSGQNEITSPRNTGWVDEPFKFWKGNGQGRLVPACQPAIQFKFEKQCEGSVLWAI